MLSAQEIVLEYACPAAGAVTATMMFAAPAKDVWRASQQGSLGSLNPTPWAVMLGNCCGWVTYGILVHNYFVYFANAPGFLLSIWFNLKAVQLQYASARTTALRRSMVQAMATEPQSNNYAKLVWEVTTQQVPAPVAQETLVLGMAILWLGVLSAITLGRSWSQETKELIVGITVNCNLVFFYGAPLSTIWTVLSTRSSATIHRPTLLTNTANGAFWCAYGLAVLDPFIAVPNGLGAALGVIQVLLCLLFPRKVTDSPTEENVEVAPMTDNDDDDDASPTESP